MMGKARKELKKNDEEMAKMYLNQAAIKQNEIVNHQRMSIKLETLISIIKTNDTHQTTMNAYNKIGSVLAMYKQQGLNLEQMSDNIKLFEKTIDDVMRGNEVMSNLLFENYNSSNIDQIIEALKNELSLDQDIMMAQAELDLNHNMHVYPNQQQHNPKKPANLDV